MDERRDVEKEKRFIYLSFMIMIVLVVIVNVTRDELFSIAAVFTMAIILSSNVIYFLRKRKKQ
jgi:hypothetical protein